MLPFGYNSDDLFEKHKGWIYKKIDFIEDCLDSAKSKELVERFDGEFKKLIYKVTEESSQNLKVKINKVYFRTMKTKWASLSPLKNLTINKYIKYLPEYLISYIVFHEIVHIIEKKHNNRFWEIVVGRYKDYQGLEKELFEYWFKLSNKIDI